MLNLLSPSTPFPPYTPEAANTVDQMIRCRQWLLHAGNDLLDPNEGYSEAWLHYVASEPECDLGTESYRTTPSWPLFLVLQSIASDSNSTWTSDETCEKEDRAFIAAKGEIFASLESTMAHFKVLISRQRLFREALKDYNDIIQDLEHNVL
jgi:hypothetical protein